MTRKTENRQNVGYEYRTVAYVTIPVMDNWRWIGSDGPAEEDVTAKIDTRYITHINFAFGMLEAYCFEPGKPGCPLKAGRIASKEAYKDPEDGRYHYRATLQGYIEEAGSPVDGRRYLKALAAMKKESSRLKVLLSIGGWDSDGFCYMAATPEGRAEFIASCVELIKEYGIDGIDLDWEYPTNGGWGEIAGCDSCVEDARRLLKEFRTVLDREFKKERKLLTIASGVFQPWVDEETFEALDYMNLMSYDAAPGTGGEQAGLAMAEEGMRMHLAMTGDTEQNRRKMNLGVPFYNEGGPYLVPYYKSWDGYVDASPEIMRTKMEWVKKGGYGGAFFWAYSMDIFEQDVEDSGSPSVKILQRTIYETLHDCSAPKR